jgi:hypothetical protein
MFARFVVWAIIAVGLCGCAALPPKFTMYPDALTGSEKLDNDMAVVLVGLSGPGAVNYLQFAHSSLPAINARFAPRANTVVALPMPVGIKGLHIQTYTVAGRPAGYIGSMPVGFISVRTTKIDIDAPGIYYLGTIHTPEANRASETPDPAQLREARARLADAVDGKQPVNFRWP